MGNAWACHREARPLQILHVAKTASQVVRAAKVLAAAGLPREDTSASQLASHSPMNMSPRSQVFCRAPKMLSGSMCCWALTASYTCLLWAHSGTGLWLRSGVSTLSSLAADGECTGSTQKTAADAVQKGHISTEATADVQTAGTCNATAAERCQLVGQSQQPPAEQAFGTSLWMPAPA